MPHHSVHLRAGSVRIQSSAVERARRWVRWIHWTPGTAKEHDMDLGKPMKRLQVGPQEELAPVKTVPEPVSEPAADRADA